MSYPVKFHIVCLDLYRGIIFRRRIMRHGGLWKFLEWFLPTVFSVCFRVIPWLMFFRLTIYHSPFTSYHLVARCCSFGCDTRQCHTTA